MRFNARRSKGWPFVVLQSSSKYAVQGAGVLRTVRCRVLGRMLCRMQGAADGSRPRGAVGIAALLCR